MKIVHVLANLGMGGAERVALDLATHQQSLGHEVSVLVLSPLSGPLTPAFEARDIELISIPKGEGVDWRLPLKVGRFLRKHAPDIVHTHNTQPLSYVAMAGRVTGHAVIHTKHGQGHLVSRGSKLLKKMGSPFAHFFVCVSEETRRHAEEEKSFPFGSRLQVIENGIATEDYSQDPAARKEVRGALGIADSAWVVGSVGRVDANKNHRALVEGLSNELGETLHLVIVGEGEKFSELREQVEALGPRQSFVHLLGRRNDVPRLMSAMDVFALPSLSEGLPIVILEAMASGLPIVSTEVGGIPKALEGGQAGVLVPVDDPEALATALLRLKDDPLGRRELVSFARTQVKERYSVGAMTQAYLTLYDQARHG